MRIGVPKETKNHEYRVSLTPQNVALLTQAGHQVFVEQAAGAGVGLSDDAYEQAGASLLMTAKDVFAAAELIIKVKEPSLDEAALLTEQHTLFTFLHLAPLTELTEALCRSGCTAIAYETVTNSQGQLPLLTPMSYVAGRMSVQAAAHSLERESGGRGVLMGGVPGVAPASVVIIGGGVVGMQAALMAVGLQADVTLLDKSVPRLAELNQHFDGRVKVLYADETTMKPLVLNADVVIGAVLVPGATAPKLVKKSWLPLMQPGAVLVDVAIDQGGCFESSRPTTHSDPTYIQDGVSHYCVANMPGAVPYTSTYALNNVTIPFIQQLASGVLPALKDNPYLAAGVNIYQGQVTYEAVAQSQQKPFISLYSLL